MDQNRFYIGDGNLYDIFVFDVVPAGLEIERIEEESDAPNVTHHLTVKEQGSEEDFVATISLTKDMMKQMVEYLSHEIKMLEDKNG